MNLFIIPIRLYLHKFENEKNWEKNCFTFFLIEMIVSYLFAKISLEIFHPHPISQRYLGLAYLLEKSIFLFFFNFS